MGDALKRIQLVDSSCDCGCDEFDVFEAGPHLKANCARCGKYRKFVSRAQAGLEERTLADRPGITVAQRGRVMERAGYRCQCCGKGADDGVRLVVAHLIDREKAIKGGVYDPVIDSEVNLFCACESCNSGMRFSRPSMALMVRALLLQEKFNGTSSLG